MAQFLNSIRVVCDNLLEYNALSARLDAYQPESDGPALSNVAKDSNSLTITYELSTAKAVEARVGD